MSSLLPIPRTCFPAAVVYPLRVFSVLRPSVLAGGVSKNFVFRPVEKSSSDMLYRRKCVSIRHGGPRPQQCTGRGIRDVSNNHGGSRSLTITRLAVRKSVDCTASHARCAIVEPTATNYTDSRIKRGRCSK